MRVIEGNKALPLSMDEAWLLCWFNGAKGWRYDAPILIVLQRKPSEILLTDDSLTFKFPKDAGFIAAMPLFGYFKVPMSQDRDYLAQHGLPSKGIATDLWSKGLPKPLVERC